MEPTLLILAAGIGSRFGGLKQAEGVGPSGEAILDYSIYDAVRAGFKRVVFVVRKDILEDMQQLFFDKWSTRVELDYVFQELDDLPGGYAPAIARQKPWGTGHAIWVARDKVREPFCMINADDFYGRKSFELASGFLKDMDNLLYGRYALIGYILKNTLSDHGYVSRAECQADEKGLLKSITERLKIMRKGRQVFYQGEHDEKRTIDENAIVSMNMWAFMPSLFKHLENDMLLFLKDNAASLKAEFLLPNVIDRLIKSGDVAIPVLQSDAQWFGMTYREDLEMVKGKIRTLIDSGSYPESLFG